MFVQLWRAAGGTLADANPIFELHPAALTELIETVWTQRIDRPPAWSPLNDHPHFPFDPGMPQFHIHHLIYAYMIENTRVFEIVEKVLRESLNSERIGTVNQPGQLWLRNTAEMFYGSADHGTIRRLTNRVRPDQRAIRRNAYYRMFGLDLNHGDGGKTPYPFDKGGEENNQFVPLFEELLRELWKAIVFESSNFGPNETDFGKLDYLVQRLQVLLTNRRQDGALRREEFDAVVTLSWLHLTVLVNSPVLQSVGIIRADPAQRLVDLGVRAGYPAHPQSYSFLSLAEPLSEILIGLEDGNFAGPAGIAQLYTTGTVARARIDTIITHWSIATGRNLKARDVNQMPVSTMAR